MSAYYNENDPYAAQWLRNLVAAGHIAPGDVDERDIRDVQPADLAGYDQCHFFAGIGGWSYALRLAGWPDDRPVWTGSCPCQPFSAAGAGKAADDSRHLWPAWFPLIAERRPPVVFGEQVEAAIGWGWLDAVFTDLESQGYACGATVLPACGIGAPHIRQRLWFVADTSVARWDVQPERAARANGRSAPKPGRLRNIGGMGYAESLDGRLPAGSIRQEDFEPSGPGQASGMVHAAGETARLSGRPWQPGNTDWIACTDGKSRPVESGTFPLAHGIRRRTSKLRAYGNAIVPQVAAEFVMAAMDSLPLRARAA